MIFIHKIEVNSIFWIKWQPSCLSYSIQKDIIKFEEASKSVMQ